MHDLVIRGGTVVDGLRNPRVVTDVAIRDGRIEAIASVRWMYLRPPALNSPPGALASITETSNPLHFPNT